MRKTFTKIFATKTRDEWTEIFSSTTTIQILLCHIIFFFFYTYPLSLCLHTCRSRCVCWTSVGNGWSWQSSSQQVSRGKEELQLWLNLILYRHRHLYRKSETGLESSMLSSNDDWNLHNVFMCVCCCLQCRLQNWVELQLNEVKFHTQFIFSTMVIIR